jgi:flavodoxin
MMRTLVVYDSQFGNTEKLAQLIAQTLDESTATEIVRADKVNGSMLDRFDLLVLGSPTQGWNMTPALRSLVAGIPRETLHGKMAAVFDTRFHRSQWITGSAARKLAGMLKEKGAMLAAAPESFFVEGKEGPLERGETDHAVRWAQALAAKYVPSAV